MTRRKNIKIHIQEKKLRLP